MITLPNAFKEFEVVAAHGTTVTIQYGYDDTHAYYRAGDRVFETRITAQQHREFQQISRDDYVSAGDLYGVASGDLY